VKEPKNAPNRGDGQDRLVPRALTHAGEEFGVSRSLPWVRIRIDKDG
jgi:hypothetical protein